MGYSQSKATLDLSLIDSTSSWSCAPRVFRRASQSGAAGLSVPRAAVRVVSKYPSFGGARQGPDRRLRTAVSSADRAESLGL